MTSSHTTPQIGDVMCNLPLAAPGLTSYRCRSPYGWIMIGAHDHADAWREARRSTPEPTGLEVWNGERYVEVQS